MDGFFSQYWSSSVPDDALSLVDSGFASSSETGISGNSTHSNFNSFVYENGRRYHAYRAGKYLLPNDEPEIQRLELHHHLFLMLLGGALYRAPLGNLEVILDIGTGAGEWAMDMAEQHPEARVIGNDLSRIQPSWAPSNCVFEVDDAESEWVYPRNYFDFVHMRSMSGCFADWPLLLSRVYEHLKPGGFVEFQDHGACLFVNGPDPNHLDVLNPVPAPPTTPFSDWWALMLSTAASRGRPLVIARNMEDMLRNAGFIGIEVEIKAWPLTPWPEIKYLDQLGNWGRRGMIESLNSFSMGLNRELDWSEKQVKDKIQAAMADLMQEDRRYWVQTYFIHAQRPGEYDNHGWA